MRTVPGKQESKTKNGTPARLPTHPAHSTSPVKLHVALPPTPEPMRDTPGRSITTVPLELSAEISSKSV